MPDSFAVALVLSRAADAVSAEGAGMRIALRTTRDAATPASTAGLEAIRVSIPAARSLPLLERLARAAPGRIVLQYLDDLALEAELLP
jgi:hypothetical protein